MMPAVSSSYRNRATDDHGRDIPVRTCDRYESAACQGSGGSSPDAFANTPILPACDSEHRASVDCRVDSHRPILHQGKGGAR